MATIKKNKNKQKEDENDDLFWYTNDHDADEVRQELGFSNQSTGTHLIEDSENNW